VGERYILKIHQNTTKYSYIVDVSVSKRKKLLPLMVFDRDQNVNNVRIIVVFWWIFNIISLTSCGNGSILRSRS